MSMRTTEAYDGWSVVRFGREKLPSKTPRLKLSPSVDGFYFGKWVVCKYNKLAKMF